MSIIDDDLFTYEVEIYGLANVPCDLNEEDDSEQQMTHGYGDDMEGDDESELTDEESSDSDDKDEVAEIFRINTNVFDFKTPIAPRNKENRGKENSRRTVPVETPTVNALVAQDRIGGQVIDKFKTGLGFNAASSTAASPAVESFVNTSEMLENQEHNKSKSDKGYHAVPPPYIGNFIPFKPDLTFMDEIVEIEPKTIRKNSFRPPIIKDWNSDDESEVEIIPKDKTDNPQQKEYKEKEVIDSVCSSHMTGNKCYLTEYEVYDDGFVSFGDGKGRIFGKGKIKTKHIEIRHHFIKDSYEKKLIQVIKIHTDQNVADLLTKAFEVSIFNFLNASIGMLNL
ncbi:hypothetical protein Tco_1056471 [Tanacetum coccineum]|uniref:Retrovirus-related Pol polyprotein from transposon TNT 1-94-like beta-barrel domain-containing protein n=1 Tax=Tanacetum coccineum TaxID=301880 RepID=A0ABQ5H3F8_9ASTR